MRSKSDCHLKIKEEEYEYSSSYGASLGQLVYDA